jgi:ubiquinone/menaquinone biosynthesis C-methylase UbiE
VKFLDPHDVLRDFGVYGAQDVADLGSGAGHFSLAAAKRLDGGRLFAIDVERDMLKRLVAEAHSAGLQNVHALQGDLARLSGVPLGDASVDRAIAANVLFQVHDRDAFVQEVRRLLKPGGKVLLVDWKDGHSYGPLQAHKVALDVTLALFSRHGFKKERDIEAGDLHYGMIFMRT